MNVATTHPSDVTSLLGTAHTKMLWLIEAAEKRGDVAGADAWRIALDAIAHARRTFDEMRSKQDWSMPRVGK